MSCAELIGCCYFTIAILFSISGFVLVMVGWLTPSLKLKGDIVVNVTELVPGAQFFCPGLTDAKENVRLNVTGDNHFIAYAFEAKKLPSMTLRKTSFTVTDAALQGLYGKPIHFTFSNSTASSLGVALSFDHSGDAYLLNSTGYASFLRDRSLPSDCSDLCLFNVTDKSVVFNLTYMTDMYFVVDNNGGSDALRYKLNFDVSNMVRNVPGDASDKCSTADGDGTCVLEGVAENSYIIFDYTGTTVNASASVLQGEGKYGPTAIALLSVGSTLSAISLCMYALCDCLKTILENCDFSSLDSSSARSRGEAIYRAEHERLLSQAATKYSDVSTVGSVQQSDQNPLDQVYQAEPNPLETPA